jgi:Spy/CpxP family protein refolding chaperone
MHGKTLTSALALALTFAATAGAQGVNRQDRPARPDRAQHDSTFRRGRGGPERMLLRGITLSADQQQKLAQLRESARRDFDANRASRKDQAAAPRPRRERGDTAGMGARRAEMQQRLDNRIAAVREILTAEQRTQFDKNVAEMKARMAERGDHARWNGKGRQRAGNGNGR